MMTDEKKRAINEALTQCDGDRAAAAVLLGIPRNDLKIMINNHPDLRASWSQKRKRKGPMDEHVMAGPEVTQEPEQRIESYAEREERLQKDFEALVGKVMPDDVAKAMTFQQIFGKHVARVVDFFGGNAMKRGQALMNLLEQMDREYACGFGTGPEALGREAIWSKRYTEVHSAFKELFNAAISGMSAKAKIEMYRQQQAANNKASGGVGFEPKTVKEAIAV
jgi:Bacterial regulatory protein, Fis family